MPLTKTTTRALAASIALVTAGATVAGAAVFHVPILGFGPAPAASATTASVRATHAITRQVAPRKVVRIRYVDDIVHRPAPPSAYPSAPVVVATYSPPSAPVAPAARTAPVPRATGATPLSAARAAYHDGTEPEREGSDHAAAPGGLGSTSTAIPTGGDQ